MVQRKKHDVWKWLFYVRNIYFFYGCGSIWDAKKREKQSGNQISIETPFCDDLGIILGGILEPKIVQESMWILSVFSEGPLGTAPPQGGGSSAVDEAPGFVFRTYSRKTCRFE